MQFETDRGAVGSTVISQISAGRKNRLWLELDGAEEALAFDQEEPETLWGGRREAATCSSATRRTCPPPRASPWLPAGHPQGYADCFDAFVAEVYDASTAKRRRRPAGLRRRPARRAAHGRGADVGARGALGRRAATSRGGRAMSESAPLLEVRGIAKQYPGVRALKGVDFDVRAGRGALPARPQRRRQVDADQVRVGRGRADRGRDPRRGRAAAGRRAVGVDGPRRRDDLPGARPGRGPAVAESVFLGHESRRARAARPRPRCGARRRRCSSASTTRHQAGRARARRCGPAAQQVVSIARALSRKVRLLIMDEPSAILDDGEVETLFGVVRRLTADGVGVIYISHRLDEIKPHRRPRDGALGRAHGGDRAAGRHAARRARGEDGRPQGRAAVPGPREARRRRRARRARASRGART